MNDILQLRGSFQRQAGRGGGGVPKMPVKARVTSDYLKEILIDLEKIRHYWQKERVISKALIDIYYTKVIAKSNRVKRYFALDNLSSNDSVVGARFAIEGRQRKHIITHYVSDIAIGETIKNLKSCIQILDSKFQGIIHGKDFSDKKKKRVLDAITKDTDELTKTDFIQIIVDSYYIEYLDIPNNVDNIKNQAIITLYKTDSNITDIMRRLGISVMSIYIINDTTLLLDATQIAKLKERAPYLIAMATEDISKQDNRATMQFKASSKQPIIPSPSNEPTVGVLDTLFDETVYFSKWVQFHNQLDEATYNKQDYEHGTAVTSLIVDGASINPELDDGCGRFKVRHFGIASGGQYGSFKIMQRIEEIVKSNPDIKVWNLALGSENEINLNSISHEAAQLDKIQHEQDVIFVVAGTNDNKDSSKTRRIGAPADSINSIVVNAANKDGQPASYSRKGLVLSFFNKPDVSSYVGDRLDKIGNYNSQAVKDDYVLACTPEGICPKNGTSFAAPWITRKVAYIIEVLGLSREVAKALIVDAAAGWSHKYDDQKRLPLIGHGIVPIRIEDVVQSKNDEIKFVINEQSETYDTYTHSLPVPTYNRQYPFVAKATLCYFPKCSIAQGIDYTDTELDIYLGRVHKKKKTGSTDYSVAINSINKNTQTVDTKKKYYIYEDEARKMYRKWDNTKHIQEVYGSKVMPRKTYENLMWGISIKSKRRLDNKEKSPVKFGLVVTLKEIRGENRLDDFRKRCGAAGWLVENINVQNRIDLYNKAQEEVHPDR